ncbi:MAG: hypothetical protein NVSMB6_29750 [Burkholderiaceae bacterium]
MPNRHTQIALGDAIPGMILTDAVLDTKGNILLPEGVALTGPMIVSLERHEIDTIAIAGAVRSSADEDCERRAQAARLARLFRVPGIATNVTADAISAVASPMPTATDVLYRYILNFRLGAPA